MTVEQEPSSCRLLAMTVWPIALHGRKHELMQQSTGSRCQIGCHGDEAAHLLDPFC